MAASAQQVMVVTDVSKFHRKGFNIVLPVKDIDIIIIDQGAPEEAIHSLKLQGKSVVLA